MKLNILKKSYGFTLAEVLITLGIIGIVAAMTLPTLIQNARYKELETRLKRSYSVISQALDMYQAQTGERIKPTTVDLRNSTLLKDVLIKNIKTVQDCGMGSNDDEACIKHYGTDSGKESSDTYKNFTGTSNINLMYFDDGQFVINDGSLVLIEDSTIGKLFISVDVNGYNKKPNRLGQDLFMFQINEKGTLIPMGAKDTNFYNINDYYCSTSGKYDMNGAGCTYKALNEKDYFKNLPK